MAKMVKVKGYTRKDGTKVKGYTRKKRPSTKAVRLGNKNYVIRRDKYGRIKGYREKK